jgi:hypothetical protein
MNARTAAVGTGAQGSQFSRHGLISITRFTYLFARGGALVTDRANFFSSWDGRPA